MSGLKEIRTRIGSVKTTRQVTSAMKMVSAAKLKKAQDAVIGFRPYARKMEQILASVTVRMEKAAENPFTQAREPEKILVVLISSNRGLCGGFNANVTNAAIGLVYSKYGRQLKKREVHFLAIGKQGERMLKGHKMAVTGQHNDLLDKLSFEAASDIAASLMDAFQKGKYDRIDLVYNEFINAAQHIQVEEQFLPLPLPELSNRERPGDPLFEPSIEEIFNGMLPMTLKTKFYKALLVSYAAEHGARMTAMHQATDNATSLLGELTLQYNKERQAAITKEILEITGGAEALRG